MRRVLGTRAAQSPGENGRDGDQFVGAPDAVRTLAIGGTNSAVTGGAAFGASHGHVNTHRFARFAASERSPATQPAGEARSRPRLRMGVRR
jgi:hypothetical protein